MAVQTQAWLITLACSHCGAPGKFVGDQLIAICDYCGQIISAHRVLDGTSANIALAECRSAVAPSLTDVRRLELADLKYAAIEARDAATMHAATCELAALDAIDAGVEVNAVATWARWTAAVEHVATFTHPELVFAPSVHHFKADPAGYTREALSRFTQVYQAISAAPEFPVELAVAVRPEVAAMDTLLTTLRSWVMFASFDAITSALVALGQRPIQVASSPQPCRTCGASITASALAVLACEYCRAAIELRRHLWLDGLLRVTAMANADTIKQDERAAAALGMLTAASRVTGNERLPERLIAAYLSALDSIERRPIAAMIELMLEHHPLGPAERTTLLVVQRNLDQVPVSIPPPPGRRVGNFIALEPSEAWRRAAARNWRRMLRYGSGIRPDELGLIAVNQLLAPLAGGFLPATTDAAAFLRTTEVSPELIRAALALHATGEHDPDKAEFWRATAASL